MSYRISTEAPFLHNLIKDERISSSPQKYSDHVCPSCGNRYKSYDDEEIAILYDGSYTFWRTGTNLDVLLVDHKNFNCYELVVFEPLANKEAPRIYLTGNEVVNAIKLDDIQNRVTEVIEQNTRHHVVNDLQEIESLVRKELAAHYIVSRISLDTFARDIYQFKVYLQPSFDDITIENDKELAGVCPNGRSLHAVMQRPLDLQPVITEHFAKLG